MQATPGLIAHPVVAHRVAHHHVIHHITHLFASLLLAVLALGLGLTGASLWIDASRWLSTVVPTTAPAADPRPARAADLSTLPPAEDDLFDEVRYFEERGR